MTRKQATQSIERLERIAYLQVQDLRDWLALCEDELKISLPDRPQLLARFLELKEQATKEPSQKEDERVRSQVRELFNAACVVLDSERLTAEDLNDEFDRIVLKSRYVKGLAILFAVLLSLITGVATFKLWDQYKAGQELLQHARQKLEETNIEVAKMRAESTNREAELSLFLLKNNEELVKLQTAAIQQIALEGDKFKKDVDDKTTFWIKQLGDVDVPGARKTISDAGSAGASQVNGTVTPVLNEFRQFVTNAQNTLRNP